MRIRRAWPSLVIGFMANVLDCIYPFDRLLHTSHPFHCSDCGEAFKRRKDLDLHSLTHQGETSWILISFELKSTLKLKPNKAAVELCTFYARNPKRRER